jgi:hypothetical protein
MVARGVGYRDLAAAGYVRSAEKLPSIGGPFVRSSRRLVALPAAFLMTAAALAAVPPASASTSGAGPGAASSASAIQFASQIVRDSAPSSLSGYGEGASTGLALAPLSAAVPLARQSVPQIKKRAVTALSGASYFDVQGFYVTKGVRYDTVYLVNTAAAFQAIAWKEGLMSIYRFGNTIYINYDAELLKNRNLPSDYENKWWISRPGDKDFQTMAALMTPSRWAQSLATVNVTRKTKGATFAGYPTIKLVGSGSSGDSLYVSTTGQPYPRYVMGNDQSYKYAFTKYNQIFSLEPPASDSIITE